MSTAAAPAARRSRSKAKAAPAEPLTYAQYLTSPEEIIRYDMTVLAFPWKIYLDDRATITRRPTLPRLRFRARLLRRRPRSMQGQVPRSSDTWL